MEEYEYIKEHYDFNSFVVKYKVKLDDGTYFFEEIDDTVSTKRKNTKKETIFLNYFTKKYLNKSIHNYLIYNIRFDKHFFYDDTRQLYFDCKCNKCGRVICQTAHDFLLEPIVCKCSDKKYQFLAEIDYEWDKGLIPYKKRIFFDDLYYDISMDDLFNMYLENNDVIYRMGFSSIKNYNIAEAYFTGCVSIPLNGKYINFENVYYNYYSDMSDKNNDMYPMSFRHKHIYNPILLFYDGEKYYDFKKLTKESLFVNKKYDSFVFIYFEKEKNNYIMNVYHNEKLIFSKKIMPVLEIEYIFNDIRTDLNSLRNKYHNDIEYNEITDYVFFSKFDNDSDVSRYRFNIKDKQMYPYILSEERRKMALKNIIDRINNETKINITLNTSFIDYNLKKHIEQYQKIDNSKYKRIFVHKTSYDTGWILYEYLKDKFYVNVLENEFSDDKSTNYCFLVEKENREILNFVDYIIFKSRDHKSYECNIYEHSISSICHILLEKKENIDKITKAIIKDKIFIFENEKDKNHILNKLDYNSEFRDYNTDHNILHYSYYKEIILKLRDKYQVDDFGLLLIFLVKYGEDVVFNLNERYDFTDELVFTETDRDKYEKIYNELLEKSGYKGNKWKNEYNLYLLVKTYFNDAIFQYKFEELGEQRIDIFIPSLNIAIEYQGEQHYFSGIFGDESDFKHGQLLDERKRKICKDNNIHLIEWHYENKINKIELDYAMYDYKELLNGKYEFSNIIKR